MLGFRNHFGEANRDNYLAREDAARRIAHQLPNSLVGNEILSILKQPPSSLLVIGKNAEADAGYQELAVLIQEGQGQLRADATRIPRGWHSV